MWLELARRTAMMTGGNRGIGRAVAAELAATGVPVAVAVRSAEALQQATRELSAADAKVIAIGGIPPTLHRCAPRCSARWRRWAVSTFW